MRYKYVFSTNFCLHNFADRATATRRNSLTPAVYVDNLSLTFVFSQVWIIQVIGNTSDPTAATTEQFAEFWGELALRFKTNPKVVFGINNEPHDMVFFLPEIQLSLHLQS